MPYLLQVDFPYHGPWGEEMTSSMRELAQSIAREPGLIWKLWTENEAADVAGGIYLFSELQAAEAYLSMHAERLRNFGVPHVNARIFTVNEALSRIDRAPL